MTQPAAQRNGYGQTWPRPGGWLCLLRFGWLGALGLGIAAGAGSAKAAVSATLVDAKLNTQRVQLQALGERGVAYFGEDRVLERVGFDQVVELRFGRAKAWGEQNQGDGPNAGSDDATADAASGADDELGRIRDVTGQRLAGSWQGGTPNGQAVRWKHQQLGTVTVPLGELAGFRRAGASLPEAGDDDVVALANGDTLTGFISQITTDTLAIEPEGANQPVKLPLKRVRAARLSNPAKPWPSYRQRLSLADGSRLAVHQLALKSETLRFLAPWLRGTPVTLNVDTIDRLRFTAAGWRLIRLADQPFELTAGGEVFGVAMPPKRRRAGLDLHAPMTVKIKLPEGVTRLATDAVLAPDAPASAVRRWAGCKLTLNPAGGEPRHYTLGRAQADPSTKANGDGQTAPNGQAASAAPSEKTSNASDGAGRRRVSINLPLDGPASLTITLDPSRNGPVLDRVLLENAQLLVRKQ